MTDHPRLIEVAFPLKQASLDSVHEKNVRHGHISTLHIWPARRPLAACRAALIATLLPDPGDEEERQKLLERIGGKVVRKVEKKQQGGKVVEVVKEETEGGILHWGRENSPDLEWFRQEIRKAYGGRTPRVLDPFAGGGAIPLEAMRLGCEATAIDINPVAWFILKCTLEYPHKLAGQWRPLPEFAVQSPEFMAGFFKGTGVKGKRQLEKNLQSVQQGLFPPPDVDLAWHVRVWGWWVLQRARADLEKFYPVVDGKPTVAYLWARTVKCKNCRATVPLLKTRWLCKKDNKRVVLTMEPNADRTGVVLGVQTHVPVIGGSAAQKREHDKKTGSGTMSRSGVTCPCCGIVTTGEDIRLESKAGRVGRRITAVVVEWRDGKEYRIPTEQELHVERELATSLKAVWSGLPFGELSESIPQGASRAGGGSPFTVHLYGLTTWGSLFSDRQGYAIATFARWVRDARQEMQREGYEQPWIEAITAYLACCVNKLADYNSMLCMWGVSRETIAHTFTRFALPITWDYCETNAILSGTGSFDGAVDWVARYLEHALPALRGIPTLSVVCHDAVRFQQNSETLFDAVVTDPPYYDAIPYSDLADFFYVWLRRTMYGTSDEYDLAFTSPLGPKWNQQENNGELIQDAARFGGSIERARQTYEQGMCRAFQNSLSLLKADGRLFVVFANKNPEAWEALATSLMQAGAVVVGAWPIVTEMRGGVRNYGRASLASSVWLICRKRPLTARPGWDNLVLEEMRTNIYQRLHDYWKAGIRGPDFVWAATGPALEAYSKHPAVKKATAPGEVLSVSEFLRAVRRIVVDFVVGRVLTGTGDSSAVQGLDDLTTYYLLHRHDFGLEDAPAGACILYAVSCGLSDSALVDRHDLLVRTGGKASDDAEDEQESEGEDAGDEGTGSGSRVKLKLWSQRKRKAMGYDIEGRPAPLIDQAHRLMHLWKAGDVTKVDQYLDERGLRRYALFHQLLQALIELAERGSDERSLLESLSNHVAARGIHKPAERTLFDGDLFATKEDKSPGGE